jgi:phosphoribosylformylglycinamidine synthase
VVGGNVSLYNDSPSGPIPPTPTVAMLGTAPDLDAPARTARGDATLVVVGPGHGAALGGSTYLAVHGGRDRFPSLPGPSASPAAVDAVRRVADLASTLACRTVDAGGLAVALADLVDDAGVAATLDDEPALFAECPGRVVVETTDPGAVAAAAGDVPVREVGRTTAEATLSVSVGRRSAVLDREELAALRGVLADEMD